MYSSTSAGGSLEEVVGGLAADVITYCVLLGYALNLIFTYPMINWGLREVGSSESSAAAACHMLILPSACARQQVLLALACQVNLAGPVTSADLISAPLNQLRLGMQVIAEVAVGRPTLGNAAWICITAVIVVAAYAVAIAVPNIWPVMVSTSSRPWCTNVLRCVAVVHTASARASSATGNN